MPFLKLTYADDTEEVLDVDGEARVQIEGGQAASFDTGTGLVSAVYQAAADVEPGEPDWDDPAFRAKVRGWLKDEAGPTTPTIELKFADGEETVVPSAAPELVPHLGRVVPFDLQNGLVSVEASDDEPKKKGK